MDKNTLRVSILRTLDKSSDGLAEGDVLNRLDTVDTVETEVRYLAELGLLYADYYMSEGVSWARITSEGRDYIDPTGGIGAELNVVTVRLHEDTIRQIFINRVKASDADETVKSKLVDQLKALPAEGLSKLAEKALEEGLRYMPHALQWLQTAQWS